MIHKIEVNLDDYASQEPPRELMGNLICKIINHVEHPNIDSFRHIQYELLKHLISPPRRPGRKY